jgi:hypothetical protein
MKKRWILFIACLVVIAAAFGWQYLASHETPAGQPPLVTLDVTTLDGFRADFNRDAGMIRLIVLLSPT